MATKNANATKTKKKTATQENAPVKSAAKLTLESLTNAKAKKVKEEKPGVTRELLYIYPADVNTADKKKDFRRKARAARASFRKKIGLAEKEGDKKGAAELRKEYEAWMKLTLNHEPALN